MPRNITVTFDDGTTHTYQNAPDNVTPDAVQARAEKEFSKSVTALDGGRSSQLSTIDQIPGARRVYETPKSSFSDDLRGIIETPFAVGANLISGPITYLSGAFGPEAQQSVARNIQYQPRTQMAQNVLESIARAAEESKLPPFMPTMGVTNALSNAARPVTNALIEEGKLIKGAVNAPLEARAAAKQAELVAQSYANAPIIDATNAAQRQGLAINPSITNPTKANRAKSMAVGPAFEEIASKNNADQVTNVVRKDLGVAPNEQLTPAIVERALDKESKPYDVIRKMGILKMPENTLDDLNALKKPATLGGKSTAAAVDSLIDEVGTELQNGRSGDQLLTDIRAMRRNAQATYKSQATNPDPVALAKADTQMSIANILENMIDANAPNPKVLSEMQAARIRMAQIYDHERAINYANQTVDPQVYAKLLDERKGNMTGVGADIGKVAATFPDVMKTVSPSAQELPVVRSGIGAATGALIGGAIGNYPGAIAGASIGGAGSWAGTRALAKRMVTSKYQKEHAVPKDYRNSLSSQQNQNSLRE